MALLNTADTIDSADDAGLGALINGRDLSGVTDPERGASAKLWIQPGKLFRSALPDRDDGMTLQLRTVIDLRDESEAEHDHPLSAVPGCTVLMKPGLNAGMKKAMKDLIKPKPCCCFKCGFCCFLLTCQKKTAQKLIMPIMLDNMEIVYKGILTDAGEALCELLDICADESNHPLLFHCSLGRDRTGVLAMLIQHVAGFPREALVAEYAASTERLLEANAAERRYAEVLPEDGTDREKLIDTFSRCPPAFMEATLQFVDETWGGLDQYLDSIGFDATKRKGLRETIGRPSEATLAN